MTTSFGWRGGVALLLALCYSLSLAQSSTEDWHITCWSTGTSRTHMVNELGDISDTGEMPWFSNPGPVEANGAGGGVGIIKIPTNGSAWGDVKGKVTIHFHWVPEDRPAPDHQWVVINGQSHWGGNQNCSGSVDNGLGTPIESFDFGQNQYARRIIRKEVVGKDFEVNYSIRAFVAGHTGGLMNCFAMITANPTVRFVDLDTPGFTPHKKLFLTGGTVTYPYPDPAGGPPHSFTYPEAIPVPVTHTCDDINTILNIDYGMPCPDFPTGGGGGTGLNYVRLPIVFQGSASQEFTPNETYLYGLSHGQAVGETLPTFGNGWDILSTFGDYHAPYFYIGTKPKSLYEEESKFNETVTFDYTWSDGVKGRAVLNVQFHPPADNEVFKKQVTYTHVPHLETDWKPFKFVSGQEYSFTNALSQMVWHGPEPEKKGTDDPMGAVIVGLIDHVVGELFPITAEAKLIASLILENLDFPEVEPQQTSIERGDFWEADAAGRVKPKDWRDQIDVPPGYDVRKLFKWKAEYVQNQIVEYTVADTWDAYGFAGRKVFKDDRLSDILVGDRRWHFLLAAGGNK